MLTGEIRSQIDQIWNAFWSGGISNPLEVIEQITYLLFLRRLDDLHTAEEKKAQTLKKKALDRRFFPEGKDKLGTPYEDYRWSKFKNLGDPGRMFTIVADHVFPWLRTLGGADTAYARHMKDARFTIPTPALLAKVVDLIDKVPMEDRDTKGDLYEYMLAKIATAGQNGQFRTPRHIIQLMVEMVQPEPKDVVCDPACGTCGFLVAVGEYLRQNHKSMLTNKKQWEHFNHHLFHGFDFDNTMLRIGSMNMLLHGVENPDVVYRDSLSQDHAGEEEKYTLVMANPPFAGSLDYESVAKDLQQVVKTKKTELLFLALFLRLLKPGGRAAVIVPEGVLFGSSNAHKAIRRMLVEDQKLDGVVSLPAGVFKPYSGVSTAILLFTKTNSGGTDYVWFYDVEADGRSLDDKRDPLLPDEKFGPIPKIALSSEEHAKNNLPDILARWKQRDKEERKHPRTAQSFSVPKTDIVAQGYDLSLSRYKEAVHEEVSHRHPKEILAELEKLEEEVQQGTKELQGDAGMSPPSSAWPLVPLHELCRPTQWPTIPQSAFVSEGYPVYGANGVIGSYTEFNHELPTVLITCRGATCGTINVCEPKSYVTGNAMALDDLRESRVDRNYLVHALKHVGLAKAISGTAQPQITRQGLTAIAIPLPPLPEQRRIAVILDKVEGLKKRHSLAIAKLDEFLLLLQHRAFRGEL